MKSMFETIDYSPTNIHFSPIICNLLAVSSSSLHGSSFNGSVVESGALFILDHFIEDISSPLKCFRTFHWPGHSLNDVSWSESSDNILWTVSSDGLIQVWDLNSYLSSPDDPLSEFDPSPDPVQVIKGHSDSITSIDWSKVPSANCSVLTSSCDTTIKLWNSSTGSLINTFRCPPSCPSNTPIFPTTTFITCPQVQSNSPCPMVQECPIAHNVTSVKWSPLKPCTFASTSSDGVLRMYSTAESPDKKPMIEFKVNNESDSMTSLDWNKFDENSIVIGTTSGSLIGLDIRSVKQGLPTFTITGHRKSVSRVTFDPHQSSSFCSTSTDSSIKIWNSKNGIEIDPNFCPLIAPLDQMTNNCPQLNLVTTFDHHTDAVTGFSFNSSIKDQVVDCSKESLVYLYRINGSKASSSPNSSSTISSSSSLDSVRVSFDS